MPTGVVSRPFFGLLPLLLSQTACRTLRISPTTCLKTVVGGITSGREDRRLMDEIENRAGFGLLKILRKKPVAPEDATAETRSDAFEQAFEQNWSTIFRLLARMVGDPAEAEDLTLETFYRLYQRNDHAKPDVSTRAWLRRVALNLGLHSIRSFRRRLSYELKAGRLDTLEPDHNAPLPIVTRKQEHELARLVLAGLSPRHSQVLLMRYSGSSYKEIAEVLQLSATSIGPLLLRAEREFARQYRALAQEDV